MKEKGLRCSKDENRLVTTMLLRYYEVVTTETNHTTIFCLIINLIPDGLFVVSKTLKNQKNEKFKLHEHTAIP